MYACHVNVSNPKRTRVNCPPFHPTSLCSMLRRGRMATTLNDDRATPIHKRELFMEANRLVLLTTSASQRLS